MTTLILCIIRCHQCPFPSPSLQARSATTKSSGRCNNGVVSGANEAWKIHESSNIIAHTERKRLRYSLKRTEYRQLLRSNFYTFTAERVWAGVVQNECTLFTVLCPETCDPYRISILCCTYYILQQQLLCRKYLIIVNNCLKQRIQYHKINGV